MHPIHPNDFCLFRLLHLVYIIPFNFFFLYLVLYFPRFYHHSRPSFLRPFKYLLSPYSQQNAARLENPIDDGRVLRISIGFVSWSRAIMRHETVKNYHRARRYTNLDSSRSFLYCFTSMTNLKFSCHSQSQSFRLCCLSKVSCKLKMPINWIYLYDLSVPLDRYLIRTEIRIKDCTMCKRYISFFETLEIHRDIFLMKQTPNWKLLNR